MRIVLMLAGLLMASLGCASPKATFEVTVNNSTDVPIVVGLLKHGGQMETGWDGPEHVMIHAPQLAERHWGTRLRAGETKVLGPQTGTFVQGTHAGLRVYSEDLPIAELVAISRQSPSRLDVFLLPGKTGYIIKNDSGRLEARPMQFAPVAKPDSRGGQPLASSR